MVSEEMNGANDENDLITPQIMQDQVQDDLAIKEEIDNDNDNDNPTKAKKRKYNRKRKDSDSVSGDNRKAAQATRTLKACELCRRQKTRCFRSSERNSCLRCIFLNKPCSFELEAVAMPMPINNSSVSSMMTDNSETDRKLDLIYGGLTEIMSFLKNNSSSSISGQSSSGNPPMDHDLINHDARLLLEAASSMKKSSVPTTPSLFFDNLYGNNNNNNNNNNSSNAAASSSNSQTRSGLHFPGLGSSQLHSSDFQVFEEDDTNVDNQFSFQSPTISLKSSPFSIINNQIKEKDVPKPILNLLNLSTIKRSNKSKPYFETTDDIISLNILNLTETIDLMNDFRRNYGRWVSFPSSLSTEVLIDRIRYKSSLLLTTCCLLSLRYSLNGVSPGDINNFSRKKRTYKDLIKKLVSDLDSSLIKYTAFQGASDNSGDIEFLQSLVILSIYSLSLSSIVPSTMDDDNVDDLDSDLDDFNLDAWFLSSIGLTTFITKSTFGTLFKNNNRISTTSPSASAITGGGSITSPFTVLYDELDSDEYQTLTILRIYNHLCLVHIINCVFSGRMCVVDEIRINYCTATLSLPSATNFDGRMVSEIGILLIAYNFIQVQFSIGSGSASSNHQLKDLELGFKSVKEELRLWYDQWEYLFSQPNLQFVELNYNFCSLVIYYCYNFSKTTILKPFKKDDNSSSNPNSNSSLYDENNIRYVLSHTSKQDILKMLECSYSVVRFVNDIASDSYFAYLSDQIHFCFYFSAICLMNILKYLITSSTSTTQGNGLKLLDDLLITNPDLLISSNNYQPIIEDLKNLINKFNRVGQDNKDDIISKYKTGLQNYLEENLL
ncbi:hypothetical protein DFJ63DRAFT_152654 [Scheffersomyces coipomensis]|uniref:uncharacterized protein n=1 Tax=Scheffersomyces coipomensis TaxID=1788519 RepID=UPI00315DC392